MDYKQISQNSTNIISYLIIFILYIIRYNFYRKFLGFKFKHNIFKVLFFFLLIFDLSSQIFIHFISSDSSSLLNLIITIIINIGLLTLIYIFCKGNLVIKIYSILIESTIWLLIAFALIPFDFYVSPMINKLNFSPIKHIIIGFLEISFTSLISLLILYIFLRKLCSFINSNVSISFEKSLFLLIPCLSTYSLANFFYYVQKFNINNTTYFLPYISSKIYYILTPLISILLGISLLIVAYILKKMNDSEEKKQKLILMKHQFESQISHIKNLEKFYENTRKFQHDISNHIICLKSLAFNDNLSEVQSYLLKLDDKLKKSTFIIKTGNPTSDCIINEKFDIASAQDIKFNCDFIIPANSPIDSFDLCILLGNSLDNAIEACNKITSSNIKKEITLKSYIRDFYMIIEIINSKQGSVKYLNNKIQTTKPNKLIHGIGIDNIREIAKKYDGIVDIIEEKNLFNLCIMLKIK